MNGTNILGRGMGYVLKDWNTGTYFKLDGLNSVLPAELTDKSNWVNNVPTAKKNSKKDYDKSIAVLKNAKKNLSRKATKANSKAYKNALNSYYKTEKEYLNAANLYNKKYYYDFDKLTSTVKVSKNTYSYKSSKFNKKNRIKKIKKGTLVKMKRIVRSGKVTRIDIGNSHFITASKDLIKKAN